LPGIGIPDRFAGAQRSALHSREILPTTHRMGTESFLGFSLRSSRFQLLLFLCPCNFGIRVKRIVAT
jgi:hypothetical protein